MIIKKRNAMTVVSFLNYQKAVFFVAELCLTSFLTTTALAEPANEASFNNRTINIGPRWKKGDIQRYEMIKSRRKIQNEKVMLDVTSRTDITIEVLSVRNDGAVLAWTPGETRVDDADSQNQILLQKMSNLFKGYRMIFEVDANGVILKIQNWPQMQATGRKMIALMIGELIAKKFAPEQVDKIHSQILSMLASEEQFLLVFAREPRALFFGMGEELTLGQPTPIPCDVENPLGEGLMPIQAQLTLEKIDKKANVAHLAWSQTVKEHSHQQPSDKSLKSFTRKFRKSDSDSSPVFSLIGQGTYDLDLSTGWVREFTTTRIIKTGHTTHENRLTMTMEHGAQ
jgi:hypothetical protein